MKTEPLERWLPWILCASAIYLLFYQLGGVALFEPDEGRNAEKAREILLLHDWLTPHENFYPVLDKPIFFYWLIAYCFKIFGVSEWAARLPSALAALGCVGVVYSFARAHWGRWQALWSGLILLTSFEFFTLARIVIMEMPLTFFLTLALCAFYQAGHTDDATRRRVLCLLFYCALGVATLIKGLIGVVVPGLVIYFYLLLSKQWSMLRRIYLIPGLLLFLAIVLPWYLEMGARHEGYLFYYFWEEHFGRFATSEFNRSEPWYYIILVAIGGFLPWSLILPFVVAKYRKKDFDEKTLFVLLWAGLPVLLFSLSRSKMAHYLLPIFPPLAVFTATLLVRYYQESARSARFVLSLTWGAVGLLALYFIIGALWPVILPYPIRGAVGSLAKVPWLHAGAILLFLFFLATWPRSRTKTGQSWCYLAQFSTMAFFLIFVVQLMIAVSSIRSAKGLAEKAVSMITPTTQLVFYDTYLAGMPYYLRSEKPIWMVTHSRKRKTFLGNYYALANREEPVTPWGEALLDHDAFRQRWRSAKQPMVIFLKEKNQTRLEQQVGATANRVGAVDEYIILRKP